MASPCERAMCLSTAARVCFGWWGRWFACAHIDMLKSCAYDRVSSAAFLWRESPPRGGCLSGCNLYSCCQVCHRESEYGRADGQSLVEEPHFIHAHVLG